jgi:predicted GNAT superfamily acetyltransferase
MAAFNIRVLETPEDMRLLEELQRHVWSGDETEVVPVHVLITAVHNGGLALGAFAEEQMVGGLWSFPGFDILPDGPHPKHCSHLLGVLPDWRNQGVGFALKRAQWQFVRSQGLTHVTWTYDPLMSRNAMLNIARLGAVCNTYRRSEYGEMRDGINAGLASDRFQVDWWIRSRRVERRLGRRSRTRLGLDHFSSAGIQPIYRSDPGPDGLPQPPNKFPTPDGPIVLAGIPSDFPALKESAMPLARAWRSFSREFFETMFTDGFLVSDFVFDDGQSFYVLVHGESTLDME